MKRVVLVAAGCLALAGCKTSPQNDASDARAAAYWNEARPYAFCVVARADEIAAQPEDPYYLYIAAQASCGQERLAANRAIERIYETDAQPAIKRSMERRVEDAAIARIVNRRRSNG